MKQAEELYWMFKHNLPVGSWNVKDIAFRMNVDESEANDVLDYALKNNFAVKNDVGGYFHNS